MSSSVENSTLCVKHSPHFMLYCQQYVTRITQMHSDSSDLYRWVVQQSVEQRPSLLSSFVFWSTDNFLLHALTTDHNTVDSNCMQGGNFPQQLHQQNKLSHLCLWNSQRRRLGPYITETVLSPRSKAGSVCSLTATYIRVLDCRRDGMAANEDN